MIRSRAYIFQPYQSITNQLGHFVIGQASSHVLSFDGGSWVAAAGAALGYFIIAELIKQNFMAQSRFMQWDAIVDTWFASLGAAFIAAIVAGSWWLGTCVLAILGASLAVNY